MNDLFIKNETTDTNNMNFWGKIQQIVFFSYISGPLKKQNKFNQYSVLRV